MRHTFRLGRAARWLPALGATMALAAVPSVASADGGGGWSSGTSLDPQTTNVPYLAWNGEELRLENCVTVPAGFDAAEQALGVDANGDDGYVPITSITPSFIVEDWSGTQQSPNLEPQIEQNTVLTFLTDDYDGGAGICTEGDAVSLYPGMARIELDITANDTTYSELAGLGIDSAQTVFKNQFLAGWMTLNDPSLTEMSASGFGSPNASSIGDPAGDGQFTAASNNGYLDVKVTGSIPMTGAWQNLFPSGSVTLPNDWVAMAHALATDSNPLDTTPWNRWDTSGDSNDTGDNVYSSSQQCLPDPYGEPAEENGPGYVAANTYVNQLDNVDNCTGGGPDGPFSTVFGQLSGADTSIGPFDPDDPADTLLPDGNLSSQDAPMPAARVDVSIAPNSGSSSDISGVGGLVSADKTVTYSRDFAGDSAPHNLYAPFYDAYIPATARGDVASGIDGAVITGDFPNFLGAPEYHFWDAIPLAANTGQPTDCLNRTPNGQLPETANPTSDPGDYWDTPSGNSSVAVYTDQNGEAQVQYDPNTGFYLDNVGAIKNADGGCDLQALYGQPIGTSTISATAKYPFKPVDFPNTTSGTVQKTVTSLWSKTIASYPKGSGSENANEQIVVVHAQDIAGNAYGGEVVCFASDGESLLPFFGTIGGFSYADTSSAPDPLGPSTGRTCVTTDQYGNAAVAVIESQSTTVDVVADFTNEGILRDLPVVFGPNETTGGTPPTVGEPPNGSGGSTQETSAANIAPGAAGTTEPSEALIKQVMPVAVHHKAKRFGRVRLLRLVTPSHARHYILVRVSSSRHTARLVMTLRLRSGHKSLTIHRTIKVKTNRTVKFLVTSAVTKIKGAHLVG